MTTEKANQMIAVKLDLRTKRKIASAVENYCGHLGDADDWDELDLCCTKCRLIVRAVLEAIDECSIPAGVTP